jgi:hypothetical protein
VGEGYYTSRGRVITRAGRRILHVVGREYYMQRGKDNERGRGGILPVAGEIYEICLGGTVCYTWRGGGGYYP